MRREGRRFRKRLCFVFRCRYHFYNAFFVEEIRPADGDGNGAQDGEALITGHAGDKQQCQHRGYRGSKNDEILVLHIVVTGALGKEAEEQGAEQSRNDILGGSLHGGQGKHRLQGLQQEHAQSDDDNILIQGETGTGKEIFAQGIHNLSSRKNEKFVAVNCAAFPETLIEGLLFGTAKGAFTGSTDKIGLIEEANHGTLFLDELNSMSLSMQAKLLRVLQEKTLRRVGSTKSIPVDVRVISSCNEDAYVLSENGALRRDLFYRLASVVVEIPPLRERLDDIVPLTWHFVRKNQELSAQPITEISPAFWERLRQHSWPGNVRELFHVLSFALSDCEGTILQEENLPTRFKTRPNGDTEKISISYHEPVDAPPDFEPGLSQLVKDYERQLLREAYLFCGRNATKTAELLKISRQNFQYYLKKYDLNSDR